MEQSSDRSVSCAPKACPLACPKLHPRKDPLASGVARKVATTLRRLDAAEPVFLTAMTAHLRRRGSETPADALLITASEKCQPFRVLATACAFRVLRGMRSRDHTLQWSLGHSMDTTWKPWDIRNQNLRHQPRSQRPWQAGLT